MKLPVSFHLMIAKRYSCVDRQVFEDAKFDSTCFPSLLCMLTILHIYFCYADFCLLEIILRVIMRSTQLTAGLIILVVGRSLRMVEHLAFVDGRFFTANAVLLFCGCELVIRPHLSSVEKDGNNLKTIK